MIRSQRLFLVLLGIGACSSARGGLFSLGPRPAELAGMWVDSAKTAALDSSVWILTPDGADRRLHITVSLEPDRSPRIEREDKRHGLWYLSGPLTDMSKRALCYQRRARDGGSCVRFRIDTVAGVGATRRRLVILGFRGEREAIPQVFLERRP